MSPTLVADPLNPVEEPDTIYGPEGATVARLKDEELVEHVAMLIGRMTNGDLQQQVLAAESLASFVADGKFLPKSLPRHPAAVLATVLGSFKLTRLKVLDAVRALAIMGPHAAPHASKTLASLFYQCDNDVRFEIIRALKRMGPGAGASSAWMLGQVVADPESEDQKETALRIAVAQKWARHYSKLAWLGVTHIEIIVPWRGKTESNGVLEQNQQRQLQEAIGRVVGGKGGYPSIKNAEVAEVKSLAQPKLPTREISSEAPSVSSSTMRAVSKEASSKKAELQQFMKQVKVHAHRKHLQCDVYIHSSASVMAVVEVLSAAIHDAKDKSGIRKAIAQVGADADRAAKVEPIWPLDRIAALVELDYGYALKHEQLEFLVPTILESYATEKAAWEAMRQSDPESIAELERLESMARYEGQLLSVQNGWKNDQVEDMLEQDAHTLDDLMSDAVKAQRRFKELLAPESEWAREDLNDLCKKPPGHFDREFHFKEWHPIPDGVLYDPGVKEREAILRRAHAELRPFDLKLPIRRLTDFSRLGVAFASAQPMPASVAWIVENLDVRRVQNGFRDPDALGERVIVVEVAVNVPVVEEPGAPTRQHVCELRLFLRPPGAAMWGDGAAMRRPQRARVEDFVRGLGIRDEDVGAVQHTIHRELDLTSGRLEQQVALDVVHTVHQALGDSLSMGETTSSAVRDVIRELRAAARSVGLEEERTVSLAVPLIRVVPGARTPLMRLGAARALGCMGHMAAQEGAAALARATTDEDPDVRNAAARALGQMGAPAAAQAAAALAERVAEGELVMSRLATVALTSMGPAAAAASVRALTGALIPRRGGDEELRRLAVRALGAMGRRVVWQEQLTLARALGDPDMQVRQAAQEVLEAANCKRALKGSMALAFPASDGEEEFDGEPPSAEPLTSACSSATKVSIPTRGIAEAAGMLKRLDQQRRLS